MKISKSSESQKDNEEKVAESHGVRVVGLCYHGATKPFFVNDKGLKVDALYYHNHLNKQLFPAIAKISKRKD